MKKFGKKARAAALGLASAGALLASASTASATVSWQGRTLPGPHSAGIYGCPYTNCGKTGWDLKPGDYLQVSCWTTGTPVDGADNVWFWTYDQYYYSGGAQQAFGGYVYGEWINNSNTTWNLNHC